MTTCRFCGHLIDADDLLHWTRCDGQQGAVEAHGSELRLGGHFDGPAYDPERDHARLTGQLLRVYEAMVDGAWRTFPEIEAITGDPTPSISAQLRHLRKRRFGAFVVERRLRGTARGLHEYRLLASVMAAGETPAVDG